MALSQPLILLLGPTASGKTALALEIAEQLQGGGECVGADSMQIYCGMDIGTAKPTPAEQARAPHHLLDVADPHEDRFTVHDWLQRAETAIGEIRDRQACPIVVGGTNLYVRALMEGLFDGPAPDPDLRARLEQETTEALRSELERVDAQAAERIHHNDRRRTIRALEVFHGSGVELSRQQTQWSPNLIEPPTGTLVVCLDWPREELNPRINARVKVMLEDGFLEEVRSLRAKGPLSRQAAEAVGYRELWEHLDGTINLEDAIEATKIRSRRFAKQQRTWMRRFHSIPGALKLEPSGRDPADLAQTVLSHLPD